MNQDKEKAILKITEEMIRQGGYNSFSFRNIASAVGIKSSSVHYHFATKEELGIAVTKYYTERFLQALGDPEPLLQGGANPVLRYVEAFRSALGEDKGMCLCGMLGAEVDILPSSMVAEVRVFFDRNISWLERAYKSVGYTKNLTGKAMQTLSLLEGAMIISHTKDDLALFDLATQVLIEELKAG